MPAAAAAPKLKQLHIKTVKLFFAAQLHISSADMLQHLENLTKHPQEFSRPLCFHLVAPHL